MAAIRWLPWTTDAFTRARGEAKPVLLSIVAPWSIACAEMERTTWADPGVIAAIEDRFVPIRVDADRRPDIAERYGLDAWPTTAFLTHGGDIITAGLVLPVDRMLEALDQVTAAFRDLEAPSREPGPAAAGTAGPVASDAELEDIVFSAFDDDYGGFGTSPKFPLAAPLSLALELYEGTRDARFAHVVQSSLDGIGWGPLYDEGEGGFFRCAAGRDWQLPQREKLLDVNAALLRVFLDASDTLRVARYRERAADTLRFIQTWLADPVDGGWAPSVPSASVDEHSHLSAPTAGGVMYAASNGAMAGAALRASHAFNDKGLGEFALKSLERVLLACYAPGAGVAHCFEPGRGVSVRGLLDDQVAMADAQLDAYEATGNVVYEMMAQELVHYAVRTMWDDEGGGFHDRAEAELGERIGRMRERLKPFVANCEASRVLSRLALATGDQGLAERAGLALAAVAPQAAAHGPLAAHYLRARRALSGQSDKLAGK